MSTLITDSLKQMQTVHSHWTDVVNAETTDPQPSQKTLNFARARVNELDEMIGRMECATANLKEKIETGNHPTTWLRRFAKQFEATESALKASMAQRYGIYI